MSVGIGGRVFAFERTEDAWKRLFSHTATGIFNFQCQFSLVITDMETDCTWFCKLDSIGKQIIHDLLYTNRIAIKPYFRILEITDKPDTLIVGHTREPHSSTFQHLMKVERDIFAFLIGLVQEVHIQQVVEKVYHMEAYIPNIFQINVSLLFLPRIHSQFNVPGYDVQRSPDIVRQGKDDILAHLQQHSVLWDQLFQIFPVFFSDTYIM